MRMLARAHRVAVTERGREGSCKRERKQVKKSDHRRMRPRACDITTGVAAMPPAHAHARRTGKESKGKKETSAL